MTQKIGTMSHNDPEKHTMSHNDPEKTTMSQRNQKHLSRKKTYPGTRD